MSIGAVETQSRCFHVGFVRRIKLGGNQGTTSCHRWDHGFANVRGSSSLRTPWALRAGRHLFSLWGQAPWVLFLGVSASTSRLVLHSRIGKLYLLLRTCPAPCFLASPKSRGPASRARPPRTTVLLTRPRPGLISALVNSLLDSH